MKRLLAASLALALAGCATPAPKAPHPDKAAIEAAEIARYSDQQLCRASDAIQPSLNVNPSSHPEYNDNLSRSKALEAAARSRNLSCYKLKAANSKAIKPMTARQKQARATAVCEGYAQRTQFANPSVAYSMCLKGAQSTPEKNAPATIRTSAVKPLSSRAQAVLNTLKSAMPSALDAI
nr:hypothetical protein [Escherichia coli]